MRRAQSARVKKGCPTQRVEPFEVGCCGLRGLPGEARIVAASVSYGTSGRWRDSRRGKAARTVAR